MSFFDITEIYVIIILLKGVKNIKKNITKVIITISMCINLILFFYIIKDKISNNNSIDVSATNEKINYNYSSYYFMTNPVDEYFSEKFTNPTLSQVELKDYQEEYLKVWKSIYDDIMSIVRNKCIYEEDIAIYDIFMKGTEDYYANLKPFLLAVMLDNFSMPESPEKHSWGTGTFQALEMHNGMVYRNACMFFVQYMEDEYNFPDSKDIELILNN